MLTAEGKEGGEPSIDRPEFPPTCLRRFKVLLNGLESIDTQRHGYLSRKGAGESTTIELYSAPSAIRRKIAVFPVPFRPRTSGLPTLLLWRKVPC